LVQLILSYKQETTGLVIGTAEDHTGVIGSEKAVGLYTLHVVARGIQVKFLESSGFLIYV